MPRRSILTATERENLLGWPEAHAELIRHYTLNATDLAIIRQHRGAANRLGYAVQLCSMRHPGVALGTREERIGESYATLRRYAPEFLEVLKFRAAPAAEGVLKAIDVLRGGYWKVLVR
jgi:hypothetical protein